LTYAAALVFVSAKTGSNVELLYKYIMHRLYGFDFDHKPQVLEKHSLFVPTGFDSQNLIS
jgi:dynein light intermediate chain 1